jgi:hypothetical protein
MQSTASNIKNNSRKPPMKKPHAIKELRRGLLVIVC